MRTLIFKITFCVLLATFFTSCKTQMTISRGASFGHCQGFCNKQLTLYPQKTIYTTWGNDEANVKNEWMVAGDGSDYRRILKLIDLEAFKKMPSTIGCPDCADGGAEWIEVKKGIRKKRVTFEFGNVPEGLTEVVSQLKQLQGKFEKK